MRPSLLISARIRERPIRAPGWEPVPQEEFEENRREANDFGGVQLLWDSGFRLQSRPTSAPSVIVAHQAGKPPSLSKLAEEFRQNKAGRERSVNNITQIRGLRVSFEDPVINDRRRAVSWAMEQEIDIPGENRFRTQNVAWPGQEGVVLLAFCALKSEYERFGPDFDIMADSFQYAPGYEVDSNASAANSESDFWIYLLPVVVLFGLGVGAIVLFMSVLRARKITAAKRQKDEEVT